MITSDSRSKYIVNHDLNELEKLFWEYDSMRCESDCKNERDAFSRIMIKYANYIVTMLIENNVNKITIPCIDKKSSKKECKTCALKKDCGF